jgi:hypothetical protein
LLSLVVGQFARLENAALFVQSLNFFFGLLNQLVKFLHSLVVVVFRLVSSTADRLRIEISLLILAFGTTIRRDWFQATSNGTEPETGLIL